MEVRGGCGYIEEWGDPRRVRDAHLGSIWEGTSNIVALDVLRAIRRDAALGAFAQHVRMRLDDTPLHPGARTVFKRAMQRVLDNAAAVAARGAQGEALARQVGSSLYHLYTAVAMAWEAVRIGSARRMHLAQLVLRHRLLPQDPLTVEDESPWLPALLDEADDSGRGGVDSINLF